MLRTVLFVAIAAVGASACASTVPSRETLSDEAEASADASLLSGYVSRFNGKLYLVLLDDKTHPSLRTGRSLWALTKDISYSPAGGTDTILVPKGFVTDLASIPRIFWTLLPPDGPWVKAAIVHDYLYYTGGTGVWKGHPRSISRSADYTRLEADRILREAMEDRAIDVTRRNIIYLAVRLGGASGWRTDPQAPA